MVKNTKQRASSYNKNDKINRTFSAAFKRKKVELIMSGKLSQAECSRLYDVSKTAVYRWLQKYSDSYVRGTKMVIQMETEALKTKAYAERVAELERIVGQKQLEIDYLNRVVEVASSDVGYDIKKKHAQTLSNGSATIAIESMITQ
jgi:transposase-like protein